MTRPAEITTNWHTCNWCRQQAANRRFPMLGDMRNNPNPWVWICEWCWPEFRQQLMKFFGVEGAA